ncbi:hypothetical protein [Fulvivirga lutimaris]|uniref:hypothetical protein n=1 Tax=Fulvivirga lutimaris TaxID=1819566 RepID=UPI0012BD7298|nr:hypothetical protein [Fulvivirga lutimaris]MTI39638.1 hypothetical protein [Fulvivirga lutimaris]
MSWRLYNKLRQKRRTTLGRIITAVLFTAILLLAILLSYRSVISKYASNVVASTIQNLIKERSGGLYVLSYDSIAIDAWKSSIYLKNFKIAVDSDSTTYVKQHKVFDISTKELRLDVGGLWTLWLTDQLTIKNVSLNSPKVNLIYRNKNTESNTKVAEETGLLIKQLKENLNHLNIGFLEVKNASISFFKEEINQANLILEISDLSLDLLGLDWEIGKKIEGIKSEKFFLRISKQNIVLPDSSAKVTAAEITYSLKSNRLTLVNLSLNPRNEEGAFADTASFHFDTMYFAGIDLNEVYQNNVLIVDSIKLEKPKLKIESGLNYLSKFVQRKDSNTSIIDSLFVRNIKLDKGHFNLSMSNIPIKVEEFNGEVLNASFGGQESGAYGYKHGKISLLNGSGKILDLQHAFSFDTLFYSSLDEILDFNALKIWKYGQQETQNSPKLFADIPSLRVTGLDEQEIIDGEMAIDSITFNHTTIEIETPKNVKGDNEKTSNIPEIMVHSLLLKQSTISLKTQTDFWKVTDSDINFLNLDFSNNDLSLTEKTSFDARLDLLEYANKETNIQASDVMGSSSAELLKSSNVLIRTNQLDVDASQVLISNKGNWLRLDPDSMHFNFISFTDYEIDIKTPDKNQKNKTSKVSIKIDSVYAPNGVLNVALKNDESIITNIDQLYMGEFIGVNQTFNMEKYTLSLSDMHLKNASNKVFIKTINTSSQERTVNLNEIELIKKDHHITDSINITSASLSDIYISNFPEDLDQMELGTLLIKKPHWHRFSKFQNSNKAILIDSLRNIKLKEIKIINGLYMSTANNTEQTLKNINAQLLDINLSKKASDFKKNTDGLLYAKSVSATIDSLLHKSSTSTIQSANLKIGQDVEMENLVIRNIKKDALNIKTPKVAFKKVAYNRLFTNSSFKANDLIIDAPEISANFNSLQSDTKTRIPISFDIQNISVNSASIDITTSENENLSLRPIDLKLSGLFYDSLTDFSNTFIPAESIELNTGKLIFKTSDGLNEIQVGKLRLSNNENKLTITNINLLPLFQKEEYVERVGHQTDWIKSHIPIITVQGLNYRRFLKEKAFIANYVEISDPEVNVYRDKNYPDSISDKKPLPTSMLKDLKNSVDIDSLHITSAEIAYSEVPVKGQKPGTIVFSKLEGSIQNITNIPSSLNIDSTMNVMVESQVMDEIPVAVQIRFNLNSTEDKFNISGKVAPHNLNQFNDFTENGAFLKIKSGECKDLRFAATADDNLAIGTMYFEYSDFKIALVDKKTTGTKKFEESIASFMANSFIVRKRNLALFRLRKGDIFFERNKEKSIFNYFSKLFISGVSSSVGYKSHKREIKKMQNVQR